MKLKEAVAKFDDWHYPWTFTKEIKESLKSDPTELMKAEAIEEEANKKEHWFQGDLVVGCKIAQNELRKKFPEEDEETLASFVRSASYNWR